MTALLLSLRTSVIATVLCLMLGLPLALVVARLRFRAGTWCAPGSAALVLPPVVAGIALLLGVRTARPAGESLQVLGIQIAFSTAAVVLAQTFVAPPFLVLSFEGALLSHGAGYEATAATPGAAPGTVPRRVTLPLMLPAIISGTVLSFARALGEFGATITFAGSLEE